MYGSVGSRSRGEPCLLGFRVGAGQIVGGRPPVCELGEQPAIGVALAHGAEKLPRGVGDPGDG